jgi:dipeptidyl aminopeptidase/acylaminoacyl peptidase
VKRASKAVLRRLPAVVLAAAFITGFQGFAGSDLLAQQAQQRSEVPERTATPRAFEPRDWYRLKTLSSPVLSPDGRYAAVQVQTVVEAENKRVNEIWVVATDGGEPVRFSSPGVDSTSPRFSEDGSLLIFSATRPGYRNTQWAVRMDRPGGEFPYEAPEAQASSGGGRGGGQGGQAAPSARSMPKDGSFIVTTGRATSEGGESAAAPGRGRGRGGRGPADADNAIPPMARRPPNAITGPLDPRRFDGMHITDMRYKANGRGFLPSTGRGNQPAGDQPPLQIFIDRKDGAGRRQLTNTAYSHRSVQVSPDGKWIAFVADRELRSDADVQALRDSIQKLAPGERLTAQRERLQTDLFLLSPSGGDPIRIEVPGSESNIEWSPDSKTIALTTNYGPFTRTEVLLVDVEKRAHRSLTAELRGDPGSYHWRPNGELLLQATLGGRNAVFRVQPSTGAMKEIIGGPRRLVGVSYDKARTKAAFVATTVDRPTELFIADLSTGQERQLTHFNRELNEEIAWPTRERFTYKSVGDVEIEAWLLRPYGYEPGRKYPLVLYIHGGPHSAYTEGWFDEFHNLAGAGMWVLYTNPRGSSGYGGEFTYSTRERWGMEDYEDLMKAVDIAIQRPDVDATRLGVTGGSYGGFMTAWITTKTDRFKAAQTDRMISNWVSWYGISDTQGLTEGEFGGTPWERWDLYIDLSPIKYANKVKTPTLIVQSEEDHRTPMADAEQWFMALKKHDVPVEFIRYPRSTHDLSRTGEPWLLTDRLHRLRQWFTYWLINDGKSRTTTTSAGEGR